LLFRPDLDGVPMRRPDTAAVAARHHSRPAELVCLALALALFALAARIVSIW
jgi:hypothetical protein